MLRFKTDEGIEFPNCKRMKMKDIFVEIIDKKHPTMPVLSVQQGMPCFIEQQKIVACLSALDDVIEKKKATLAAWEELKKGLLQQMFV